MRHNRILLLLSAATIFFASGCVPLVLGTAAVGTGGYFYVNGELRTDYYASFDKVWEACEKTLADMRALKVEPYKEIGKGNIAAIVANENVELSVQYKAKNVTMVSVRVGFFGNRTASQLLHDKIGDNISPN